MPDLHRAYRRWLFRKLLLLLPATAASAALGVRQALRIEAASGMLWIDLACLGAASVLALVCAWLAFRCTLCHLRCSRTLRHELDGAGPVGIVVLSLAALVAVLPSCFPPLEPVPDLPARIVRAAAERAALETAAPRVELVAVGGAETEPAPAAIRSVPPRKSGLMLPVVTTEGRFLEIEQEEPTPWKTEETPVYRRLGVPDPKKPFEWMRDELHVEVLLLEPSGDLKTSQDSTADLDEDLDMRGAGLRLYYDLPTARDEALRFQYQFYGLSAQEDLLDIPDSGTDDLLVWQRFGIVYLWQVTGYTTESDFDFAVSVGLMGDNLLTASQGGVASEVMRLSPYFGAEIGLWENGPAGLVFRFGQTIPANLTGADARVTELTVVFRLDLTDILSAHVGYGATWAKFRDYRRRGTDKGEQEELSLLLHGPVLGLDIRF